MNKNFLFSFINMANYYSENVLMENNDDNLEKNYDFFSVNNNDNNNLKSNRQYKQLRKFIEFHLAGNSYQEIIDFLELFGGFFFPKINLFFFLCCVIFSAIITLFFFLITNFIFYISFKFYQFILFFFCVLLFSLLILIIDFLYKNFIFSRLVLSYFGLSNNDLKYNDKNSFIFIFSIILCFYNIENNYNSDSFLTKKAVRKVNFSLPDLYINNIELMKFLLKKYNCDDLFDSLMYNI